MASVECFVVSLLSLFGVYVAVWPRGARLRNARSFMEDLSTVVGKSFIHEEKTI